MFINCMYRYTWQIYSERLLTLTGVYGFWKHVSNLDRLESRRYLEMFYALKYRKLVSRYTSFDKIFKLKYVVFAVTLSLMDSYGNVAG